MPTDLTTARHLDGLRSATLALVEVAGRAGPVRDADGELDVSRAYT